MNEGTNINVKFKNSVEGLKKIEKYEERMKSLKNILENMPNTFKVEGTSSLTQTNKEIDKVNNKLEKSKTLIKEGFSVASFVTMVKSFKELIANISKFTSKIADYVENINLMNVAFHRTKDSVDEASLSGTKFVNTLSEMYNLDESNLTRTVGIFKQLANAMNLSDDVGTNLAKTLTRLSIDTASLYNLSFERASSVLQSALAGQTKPVRSAFGADITETTLQVTLDTYGIDKTVRDLSFAEKRLIIVTSLLNQLTESQNDYGKTVNSVANQMRIFDEQLNRLGRAIGSVFMPMLQAILPYLNAILMVLTEVISAFAVFIGFDEDMFAGFSSGDVTTDIWDMSDALGSAGEKAKSLKQGLRGFDKLNVINTPTSNGGSAGGGINVDSNILDAFNKSTKEYEERLENIKTKATEIRDRIMEWLGFTKLVDEKTGDVSFKFDHITGGTVLGGLAVGGVIFSGVKKILGFLSKIGMLKFPSLTTLTSTLSKIGTFIGGTGAWKTLLSFVDDIAIGFGGWATGAWSFSEAWSLIAPALAKLSIIVAVVIQAYTIIKNTVEQFKNFKNLIEEPTWENFTKTMIGGLKSTGIAGEIVVDKFKKLGINVEDVTKIVEFFGEIAKQKIIPIGNWINEHLIIPFEKFRQGVISNINTITSKVEEIKTKFGEVKDAWSRWWNEDIKPEIIDGFIKGITDIGNEFKSFYDKYVKDSFIGEIIEGIAEIKTYFVETVFPAITDGFLEYIKWPINQIFSTIEKRINSLISIMNSIIKTTNKVTNSDIKQIKKVELPRLKAGIDFVPNDYFGPVYLDYGERVLTKEENKDYSKGISNSINGSGIGKQTFSPTFIIQVGSKEIAREVFNDLNDMAIANGSEIVIGG